MIQQLQVVVGGGGLDPDVAAWRAAIFANGGSVSASWVASVNRFVRACRNDALWDGILDFGLFAGVDNLNAVLVKLKTPPGVSRILTNVSGNFVSANYTPTGASAGLLGNGSNTSLESALNTSSLTAANASFSAYRTTAGSAGDRNVLGSFDGASNLTRINHTFTSIGSAANGANRPANLTGMICISATAANAYAVYDNGALVGSNSSGRGSAALANFPLRIFTISGVSSTFTDSRLTAYHAGVGLSASQVATLSMRVNDLMRSIGANAY